MTMFELIVFILMISNIHLASSFIAKIPLDGTLNFTGLAIKYGMTCEEYDVTTEDGYVLKMFHIPGDNTRPVLLMHGLLLSSDVFVLRGDNSMVSSLHKENYDIWVSNFRGNVYSRRHVTLDPDKDPEFWNFGPHEHGIYDLSTSIDFVLNKTNEKRLSFIGFSEGNMIMYILASTRPEYNDKIKIFIAWAPICYVHNVIFKLPYLLEFSYTLRTILRHFKIEEIMGYYSAFNTIGRTLLTQNKESFEITRRIIFTITGYDPDGTELEYIPIILGHFPCGTSRKNLEHLFQILLSHRFAQYDYGPIENLKRYELTKPPVYHLEKVTANIAMIVGENDNLSTMKDIHLLMKKLPNIVDYTKYEKLNHIDLIWGRYSYKNVYPNTVKILEEYNK